MADGITGTISGLPSYSDASLSSASTSKASSALGKDSFLKLLTAQLQHQDPLSPMDNSQFVAQLAQFSSLEQLQNLGSKLDSLLLAQSNLNQMSVPSLVGKDVLYRTDHVSLTQGQPARFQVSLAGAAAETTAILTDGSGNVVRTLSLGARTAGTFDATWDGLDQKGNALGTGDYVLTVHATGLDGTTVTSSSLVRGTVRGVTFEGSAPQLLVGSGTVALGDVVQITTPTVGS